MRVMLLKHRVGAHMFVYNSASTMASLETNTRKIVGRLAREGWVKVPGGKHDKYVNPDKPGVLIVVPRHREQSRGVARGIAKDAGWI